MTRSFPAKAALLVLALVAPTPSASAVDTDPSMQRLEQTRTDLRAIDPVVAGTSVTTAIAAGARLTGDTITPLAVASRPAILGLPADAGIAVANILAALDAGTAAVDGAIDATPAELGRARVELDTLLTMPRTVDSTSVNASVSAFDVYRERWSDLASRLDRAAVLDAAATVADAVERALPALRTIPGRSRIYGGSGCNVVDQAPALCIGGYDANTYTADYALMIDLGGNDRWENHAGGADALGGRPGAIAIDLGGNDEYVQTDPTAFSQGASYIGIGMLLDAYGNDRYEAAVGQGLGYAGAGILADLQGDDEYLLSSTTPGIYGTQVYGQGYSVFGALGLSLDAAGDDVYRITSTPSASITGATGLPSSDATASGFGLGAFAALGLSVDAGGTDLMEVTALTAPLPNDATTGDWQVTTSTYAFGMGIGPFTGFGVALGGSGDTTRITTAHARGPRNAFAFPTGMGFGIGDGIGAVLDASGADRYEAHAITEADRTVTLTDGCICDDEIVGVAGVAANSIQGVGSIAGVGLLVDLIGDDAYIADASAVGTLSIEDARTDATTPARGRMVAGSSQNLAQGSSLQAAGLIEDVAGDDEYRIDTFVSADAVVGTGTGPVPEAIAGTGFALSVGQGAAALGYAELKDLGGTDSYSSTNITETSARPPTLVVDGDEVSAVQASSLGLFVTSDPHEIYSGSAATFTDIDYLAPDMFTARPPNPTCTGARGVAIWTDCAGGFAIGVNT